MAKQIVHQVSSKVEDQINPWNAEDLSNSNGYDQVSFSPYHQIIRNTISFNPETRQKPSKKQSKVPVFTENLRKYQIKKAEQLQSKNDINFIEKNRKNIIEEVPVQSIKNQVYLPTNRHFLPLNRKPNQLNWSLIMYYDSDKKKRKYNHKDIQSFLKTYSHRTGKKYQEPSLQHPPDLREQDPFQKMLKIREGIRKRNMKSASASRKKLLSSPKKEHRQQSSPKNIIHSDYSTPKTTKNHIRSSFRPKERSKTPPNPLLEQSGISERDFLAVVSQREQRSDQRMIHSSNRGRSKEKVLSISMQYS